MNKNMVLESEIVGYIVRSFMGIECNPGFSTWLGLLGKNGLEIRKDIKSHLPGLLLDAKIALTEKEKDFPQYDEKDFDRLVDFVISALYSYFFPSPKREEKKEFSEEYVPKERFLEEV